MARINTLPRGANSSLEGPLKDTSTHFADESRDKMKFRVALLFVLAAIPFLIILYFPEAASYRSIPGGWMSFYFCTGFTWCSLFVYTCYRGTYHQFKRLLWLLPLVLFATGVPAFIIWLYVGSWVQALRGVAPP